MCIVDIDLPDVKGCSSFVWKNRSWTKVTQFFRFLRCPSNQAELKKARKWFLTRTWPLVASSPWSSSDPSPPRGSGFRIRIILDQDCRIRPVPGSDQLWWNPRMARRRQQNNLQPLMLLLSGLRHSAFLCHAKFSARRFSDISEYINIAYRG